MEIFAFILIGGIWAAFLLPSVVDGRRQAPMTSMRGFARSKDLLASVAASDFRAARQRRRNGMRRRRILAWLAGGAMLSLTLAIMQGSSIWLAITLGFDLAFAGYVTLLLHAQQAAPSRAPVVALHVVADPEPATVRVVAG